MSLSRWRRWSFAPPRLSLIRAGTCAFLFAGGLVHSSRAQIPFPPEVRVFIGYENQRADLDPPRSALDGVAVSLERLVPPSAGSLLLDMRGAFRSGPPVCFEQTCDPTAHQLEGQLLALTGLRTSIRVRGGRVFFDGLGGIGLIGTSWDAGWSPVAEGGAGFDAPLGARIDARMRASMLFSDFDDERWQGWRHHIGLLAGIVLRPGE
jgi:hypothetical protein